MKKWLWTLAVALILGALALSADRWLPALVGFAGAESDTLAGLVSLVQLVLWLGGGGFVLVRLATAKAGGVGALLGFGGGRAAVAKYLRYLGERYQYLELRGMGISDRVSLQLPLVEMYVPLKARVEMPEGETWARQLRLAGRKLSKEEVEAVGERLGGPQAVLDLLGEHDGLVILGDPGAGKTTFLKYLTLRLAARQGKPLGLAKRLPFLLPLSAYAAALAEGEVGLERFLAAYAEGRGLDLELGPILRKALAKGRALILLDGLDEVRETARRGLVVERVKDFYAQHRGAGNKFVLTSRVVGYREVRPTAERLGECTLVDFEGEEIEAFVGKWTSALERAASGSARLAAQDAARERRELLDAIRDHRGVQALAANPLLLTILALMKRQGVSLPERRVELYQKYVETLLRHWNLARSLDGRSGREVDVLETLRVLAPLALWMQQESPGVGLVKEAQLNEELERIYARRSEKNPKEASKRFLADVREYAGLLLDRGGRQYGFIHLTFQEYLAGVALAQLEQRSVGELVAALSPLVGKPEWREVILLALGYLGVIQQRDEAASSVVEGLLEAKPGAAGEAEVLVGDAVADAWPGGVTSACRQRVIEDLLATLCRREEVQPMRRAEAGRSLGRLGDPREGVTTLAGMELCRVPAGAFWWGGGHDYHKGEDTPWERRELAYGYWISRFPVTQAQYEEFVETGGYTEERYWTEAREAGVWDDGKITDLWDSISKGRHLDYGEPFSLPNHPVVGVTWYEALAFTRWLTERLQAEGLPEGWAVRLPSEEEWEKAARGGLEVPVGEPGFERLADLVGSTGKLAGGAPSLVGNPTTRRKYPWGEEEISPEQANYEDTGIGATSSVGVFPRGRSPYGCEELAGNVWEWCRDLRSGEPTDRNAGVALRGGSWGYPAQLLAAAIRVRVPARDRDQSFGFRVLLCRGSEHG